MIKSRGNLETSNSLEELPFPVAHSMGTELQGSGKCTVPIQPHRKCAQELLLPWQIQMLCTTLRRKSLCKRILLLNSEERVITGDIKSAPLQSCFTGLEAIWRTEWKVQFLLRNYIHFQGTQRLSFVHCFPQCDGEGFCSIISETQGNVNKKRLTKINKCVLFLSPLSVSLGEL